MSNKMKRTQKELEAGVISGDIRQYAELFIYYYRPKIIRFFKIILGETEEVAEKLTHRTCLRAIKKLEEGKFKPGSLYQWTKKIAYRIWLKYIEKKKGRVLEIIPFSQFRVNGSPHDRGNSYLEKIPNNRPPNHGVKANALVILARAERILPEKQFIVFKMKFEGYSTQQIAEATGLPKEAIKVYFTLALKKVKEICKRKSKIML